LNIFNAQAWEISENVFDRIAVGQARKDSAQGYASSFEYGFTARNSFVSNDPLHVIQIVCPVAHVSYLNAITLILASKAVLRY